MYAELAAVSCEGHGCQDGYCLPDPANPMPENGTLCNDEDDCTPGQDEYFGGACIGRIKNCVDDGVADDGCDVVCPYNDLDLAEVAYPDIGISFRVVRNRLVVQMIETSSFADVVGLAGSLTDGVTSGRIVTKWEAAKIYAIEVPASSLQDLDAFILQAEADSRTEWATYSMVLDEAGPMMNPDDNYQAVTPSTPSDCAWLLPEYPQGLALFQALRPVISTLRGGFRQAQNPETPAGTRPIRVLLADSGLSVASGQFSAANIKYVGWSPAAGNASAQDVQKCPNCYQGHGTAVGHIIAGDANGTSGNGLATAFLGKDVQVMVTPPNQLLENLLPTVALYGKDADVVNLSLAKTYAGKAATEAETMLRKMLALSNLSNTLVVVAAPNDEPYIYGSGSTVIMPDLSSLPVFTASAGLLQPNLTPYPNLLAVTGTNYCDAETLWDRGPVWYPGPAPYPRMAAAPADGISTITRTGSSYVPPLTKPKAGAAGISFAVPQITSLAAILKWVDPTMTPGEIKDKILAVVGLGEFACEYYLPQDPFGNSYVFPSFFRALAKTLHERSAGHAAQPLIDYYVAFVPPLYITPEQPGLTLNRLFGELLYFAPVCTALDLDCAPIFYTHEQYNPFSFQQYMAGITISQDEAGTTFWKLYGTVPDASHSGYSLDIKSPDGGIIDLGARYRLALDVDVSYRTVSSYLTSSVSLGDQGYLELFDCEILQRHQHSFDPLYVRFTGRLTDTQLDIDFVDTLGDSQTEPNVPVPGTVFSLLADVNCVPNSAPCTRLEEQCYGGMQGR